MNKNNKHERIDYHVTEQDLLEYEGLSIFSSIHLQYLRWSDEDDVLRILNYFEIPSTEEGKGAGGATPLSAEDEMKLRNVRGWVYFKDSKKLLNCSMPYPLEWDTQESGDIPSWMNNEDKTLSFLSMEGTLLRMFYHNEKWYLSTNKKLDAFQSRWSSRFTFGNMFTHALGGIFKDLGNQNVLSMFEESLDKSKIYAFLIRSNQENRVVCRSPSHTSPKNKIIYLGWWNKEQQFTFSVQEQEETDDSTSLTSNTLLKELSLPTMSPYVFKDGNKEKLFEWIENNVNIWEHQGLLFFNMSTLETIRIVPKEYRYFSSLRGNHPNLFLRYFEIRQKKEDVVRFCELYEKQAHIFDDYEHALFQAAKQLGQMYVFRYIKDRHMTLPKEEYYLLKKCHEWNLKDRVKNRVHTRTILELLNAETPIVLFRLSRKYLPARKGLNSQDRNGNMAFPVLSDPNHQNNPNYNTNFNTNYNPNQINKVFSNNTGGKSYADMLLTPPSNCSPPNVLEKGNNDNINKVEEDVPDVPNVPDVMECIV
jgi:hypothetical protein